MYVEVQKGVEEESKFCEAKPGQLISLHEFKYFLLGPAQLSWPDLFKIFADDFVTLWK